jgi:hypothetical protein
LDALVAEGVSPVGAFGDAEMSLDDLHSSSTRISRNQLIQCYRNAAALSRDPHLPYTIGSNVHLSAYGTIEPLLHPRIDSVLYRFVTELQIATHISLHRDIMGEFFKPR